MAHSTTVFGIPNCDTVKKSRLWLAEHGVAFDFHDFKKQGVPEDGLTQWVNAMGWEPLLNRKGTTWRKLPADAQASVVDAASAMALMCANPSVIKRPVVVSGAIVTVGFAPEQWKSLVA
jgi:Spx/MgsR family transcriptional regulator